VKNEKNYPDSIILAAGLISHRREKPDVLLLASEYGRVYPCIGNWLREFN